MCHGVGKGEGERRLPPKKKKKRKTYCFYRSVLLFAASIRPRLRQARQARGQRNQPISTEPGGASASPGMDVWGNDGNDDTEGAGTERREDSDPPCLSDPPS